MTRPALVKLKRLRLVKQFRLIHWSKSTGLNRGFRWAVASARISQGRGSRAALDVFWVTDRQATGYQVRYCTRKDMRGARTVSCGRGSHRHVGGLRRNSWYYVQVRKVHREHGRVYYSNWSARMIVRTR